MRYEIRVIEPNEMVRTEVHFADEIEIKKSEYTFYDEEKGNIGYKVGFKPEGKKRNNWIHAVRNMVQILDKETGDVKILKSDVQNLEEMGRHDIIEKWYK